MSTVSPAKHMALYAIGWYSAIIAQPELAFSADFWRGCQQNTKSTLGLINDWGWETESLEAKAAIQEGYRAAELVGREANAKHGTDWFA